MSFGHDDGFDAEKDILLAVDAASSGGPPGGKPGLSDMQRQAVNFASLFVGHVFGNDGVFSFEEFVESTGEGSDVLDAVVHEVFDEVGSDDVARRIEVDDGKDDEFRGQIDLVSSDTFLQGKTR